MNSLSRYRNLIDTILIRIDSLVITVHGLHVRQILLAFFFEMVEVQSEHAVSARGRASVAVTVVGIYTGVREGAHADDIAVFCHPVVVGCQRRFCRRCPNPAIDQVVSIVSHEAATIAISSDGSDGIAGDDTGLPLRFTCNAACIIDGGTSGFAAGEVDTCFAVYDNAIF